MPDMVVGMQKSAPSRSGGMNFDPLRREGKSRPAWVRHPRHASVAR